MSAILTVLVQNSPNLRAGILLYTDITENYSLDLTSPILNCYAPLKKKIEVLAVKKLRRWNTL